MGKPELGLKCTCVNCAERFYDLQRTPAVCPKCKTEQPKPKPRVFAPGRPSPRRWADRAPTFTPAEPEAAEPEAAEVLDDADEVEVADDDEDEAVIADVDDPVDAEPHRD